MEAVAVARRNWPPGGAIPEDYVFQGAGPDGDPLDIKMSELFSPGKDSVVAYNFMFPRSSSDECPGPAGSRTALLPLSDGSQMPMLNVFHRKDGVIRHFWGAELLYASTEPGQDYRHVGTIEPLWNLLDLTPEGRGSGRDEQLDYSCCAQRAS